jgi:hypothetical protein
MTARKATFAEATWFEEMRPVCVAILHEIEPGFELADIVLRIKNGAVCQGRPCLAPATHLHGREPRCERHAMPWDVRVIK